MSDELQYGQPVLVYGCEDEPAYLARFWRGCGEPDRVWVVVFEQSRSPYPKADAGNEEAGGDTDAFPF